MRPCFPLTLLVLSACAVPDRAAPRVVVAPVVAEAALEAFDLWARASGGEYSPDVVVSEDCEGATWCVVGAELEGCGVADEPYGCTHAAEWPVSALLGVPPFGVTLLDTSTPAEWWTSTLAHEIGHQLGLSDSARADVLMNQARSDVSRAAPCVDAATLAAAGLGGEGACSDG